MARTYKRDSIGRFAGGGGSSGGSKAASTRKANTARAAQLRAKGTTGIGTRVRAKGFAGGKGAQMRIGGLRTSAKISGGAPAFTVRQGGTQSGAQRAATKAAMKRGKRSSKPPARTNKAPMSGAKMRWKELSSRARKSSPNRSAAENRSAAGARRSMVAMVAKRGRR